jgi:hypothetical protein
MSKRAWFELPAVIVMCGLTSCGKSPDHQGAVEQTAADEAAVVQTFYDYRSALMKQKGDAAVAVVAPATLEKYQEYRDLAMKGNEKAVKSLSLMGRTTVLMMRHRIGKDRLKPMDGKMVFAYAVDQNWIGKEGVAKAGVTKPEVIGPVAVAKVTVNGETSEEEFHFVKHDGKWLIDLEPNFTKAEMLLQKTARDQGMEENEFLFVMMKALTGRELTEEIWQPLE